MIQFHSYFSDGLVQPPTSLYFWCPSVLLFFSARKTRSTAFSCQGSGALGVFRPEVDEAPGIPSATGDRFAPKLEGSWGWQHATDEFLVEFLVDFSLIFKKWLVVSSQLFFLGETFHLKLQPHLSLDIVRSDLIWLCLYFATALLLLVIYPLLKYCRLLGFILGRLCSFSTKTLCKQVMKHPIRLSPTGGGDHFLQWSSNTDSTTSRWCDLVLEVLEGCMGCLGRVSCPSQLNMAGWKITIF